MRLKIFPWLGQEFIEVSWDGNGQGTVDDEVRELFGRFESTLREFGLTLAQVRDQSFPALAAISDVEEEFGLHPRK